LLNLATEQSSVKTILSGDDVKRKEFCMKKHVFLVRHLTHKQRMTGLVLLTAGALALLSLPLYSCVSSEARNRPEPAGSAEPDTPFPLAGGATWGGITVVRSESNRVILNGKVSIGGYVNEHHSRDLAGKTLILEFSNTGNSIYSEGRLVKMTVNRDDAVLAPEDVTLIHGEYLPADNSRRVAFRIPDDFDGKLGFVFFEADLRDLQISAYYR
jgi:hypothetical protein